MHLNLTNVILECYIPWYCFFQVFMAAAKMGLFVYMRSCLIIVVKERRGALGMMWVGVAMQSGGLVGSVLIHVINVVLQPFHREPPCPDL